MKKFYFYFPITVIIVFMGINAKIQKLSAEENLLQQKCTKCHAIKIPDNYTKADWKFNVERMAQRAGLTPKEIQSIIDLNKK